MASVRYDGSVSLTCAETAKHVRGALKQAFPGTKFSVRSRSYSGGASMDVRWTDGPAYHDVDNLCQLYAGATFDGMLDLKEYHDSILVDEDGVPMVVHFGANFIFCHQDISKQRSALFAGEIRRFVRDHPEVVKGDHCWTVDTHEGELYISNGGCGYNDEYQLIHRLQRERPAFKGTRCDGGEGIFCPSCNRYQGASRAPHLS